jgi:PTS system fructose-specific IIA component
MKIDDILQAENILLSLDVSSKDDALKSLGELLFKNNKIKDLELFMDDLYKRESAGFTGAGKSIAIPHGISDSVDNVTLAIARLNNTIDWETWVDIEKKDREVRLIIMFAVPSADVDKEERNYIEALKIVMRKLADVEVLKRLLSATSENEIMSILLD